jgi:6,7-dimethyl-8-ribityllumazine synthase
VADLVALLLNSLTGLQQMNDFRSNFSETRGKHRIAFVQSCWHRDIVDAMRDSFSRTFSELDSRSIDYFEVPGAFEIPLKAKILALTNNYAAVCCGGLVVDGGIYRHEFVAHAVISGLMQVQLDTGIPVFSGVLTPQDFLSDGQPAFFKEHFITKGKELASACHQTLAG